MEKIVVLKAVVDVVQVLVMELNNFSNKNLEMIARLQPLK